MRATQISFWAGVRYRDKRTFQANLQTSAGRESLTVRRSYIYTYRRHDWDQHVANGYNCCGTVSEVESVRFITYREDTHKTACLEKSDNAKPEFNTTHHPCTVSVSKVPANGALPPRQLITNPGSENGTHGLGTPLWPSKPRLLIDGELLIPGLTHTHTGLGNHYQEVPIN